MSLCNTYRLFAGSVAIVLAILGPAEGFAIRPKNIVKRAANEDLQHQESLTVELKNDFKRPNDINSVNNAKNDVNLIPLDDDVIKKNINKNPYQAATSTSKAIEVNDTGNVKTTNNILETSIEITTISLKDLTKVIPENNTQTTRSIDINTSALNKFETENKDKNELLSENTDTKSNGNIETTTKTQDKVFTTMALNMETEELISNNEKQTTDTIMPEFTKSTNLDKYEEMKMSSSIRAGTSPTWKKYTTIERKRFTTTSEESITSTENPGEEASTTAVITTEKTISRDKSEVMVKSESAQARVSLEDAITSDIPSLEQLKTDLLSFSKVTSTDSDPLTLTTSDAVTITEPYKQSTSIIASSSDFGLLNTVSSKRAGYLDLSAKSTVTTEGATDLEANGTTIADLIPLTIESDNQDEATEDKNDSRNGSQSQLAEDAIKEELLKEEMLNDNEENVKRQRDEELQTTVKPALVNIESASNETFEQSNAVAAPEDRLSVKPINSEKTKNTMLYPVNPNYKPLKKIEVQPAKPFVRDPDDNSWRNESLSSLGIVFKPKNSSKPFTQVLKNKTETEWNNLSEKDKKSDVPDLRVRLEQIAQKRKSKKKKTDSFGNIFYTDYEENSSSEEASTPQVEDPLVTTVPTTPVYTTDVTIVTPVKTSYLPSTISSTPIPTTISPLTQNTEKPNKVEQSKGERTTTVKPGKVYNLFDYYDNNEDDIADYLNMAKIDLKKFTVPLDTSFTTFTSPPVFTLYTSPMTHITGRTGSIQYFPPLTTKRPRKNKNNPGRSRKIISYTKDYPKNVLPISFNKLTTLPYDDRYTRLNEKKIKDVPNARQPKNYNRNLFLTTPPLTTMPGDNFGVIGNDGGYNRANYVINQYRDFINEGGKDTEYERNADYAAYTQPPAQGVTMNGYMKAATDKENVKLNEDYDYETQFRKDVLDRFVANFNENTVRFKSGFPLLYNNSVVHNNPNEEEKDVATSRAYFRRPYGGHDDAKPHNVHSPPYDPNCENVTVELSPAYELHYYVPEQEEKEEVEAKPVTVPINYRL